MSARSDVTVSCTDRILGGQLLLPDISPSQSRSSFAGGPITPSSDTVYGGVLLVHGGMCNTVSRTIDSICVVTLEHATLWIAIGPWKIRMVSSST